MISDEFRPVQCNLLYLRPKKHLGGGKKANLKGELVFDAAERFKRYQLYLMWMKCIKYKFSHLQYQPSLHYTPALWNNRDRKEKKTTITKNKNLRRIKCCARKSNENQRNEKQKAEFVIQKKKKQFPVCWSLSFLFNKRLMHMHKTYI